MARNSEQDGVATDLARQAADKARQAAGWLADRDPGSLLDEVRSFARKKPGTYLALALGAGVLAGRLTRGLTAPTDGHTPPVARPHPRHRASTRSAPGSTRSPVAADRRPHPVRHRPGHRPAVPVTDPAPAPGTDGGSGAARWAAG